MNPLPWLTILTVMPVCFGAAVWLLGSKRAELARPLAIASALLSLVIVGRLWAGFDPLNPAMQAVERAEWIPSLSVYYHLGMDGMSLTLLALTSVVVLMSLAATTHTLERPQLYYALVLFLQSGLFGTFTALNFFHWFLFWELSLVPAFFLIKLWGGPGRTGAAMQFFVYTRFGSIALLLAFVALFLATGSFEFQELSNLARDGALIELLPAKLGWTHLSGRSLMALLFLGVFLGFAVKVPLVPFHSWLPSTYSEASSPVTMLLTGAMSKMGVYGFLRILLPIFPEPIQWYATPLLILAVLSIILPAAAALAQTDLKRVFAYSSINHLGYCLLAAFAAVGSGSAADKTAALTGAMLQMFNHGFTAASLFWLVSSLEQRTGGVRDLRAFGGLRENLPVLTGLMGFAVFSSLGLPGLNGFIGEFLIFKGSFGLAPLSTAFATIGLLLTAVFLLRVLDRVFYGPLSQRWAALPDLTTAERLRFAPIIAGMLLLGIYPQFLLGPLRHAALNLIGQLPN